MLNIDRHDVGFELRPSPKWVALLLVLAGFVLVYLDLVWFEASIRYKVQIFELMLYVLTMKNFWFQTDFSIA